jgi:parvulin-like peptidyl-prolyl isomerase
MAKSTTVKKTAPSRAKSTTAKSSPTKTTVVKKAPIRKRASTKKEPIVASITSETKIATPKRSLPIRLKKSHMLIIGAILLTAALLFAFRSIFVAALVNGQPITRVELVRELEKQNGKQALNSLITKTLILQEARKQNVSVTQEEVDNEIKKIEGNLSTQGQKLDDVLALQGLTRDSLQEQVRIQKLVEKMVGKDIKITDKEVAAYMEQNKEVLGEATKAEDVKQQLQQEQLSEKFQTWIQNLQKNANIMYLVNF